MTIHLFPKPRPCAAPRRRMALCVAGVALLAVGAAPLRAQTAADSLGLSDGPQTVVEGAVPVAGGAQYVTENVPAASSRLYDAAGGFVLPAFDFAAPPSAGFPCGGWRLHEGFNAQLGMSLSVGVGRHAPRGAGFGQNAAFAYVLPLSRRFSAAAGVMVDRLDWGRYSYTDASVAAALRFEATERFSLYAYAAHSLTPASHRPWSYLRDPFSAPPRERVGVMGELKLGENAMISVSVEHQRR